MEIKKIIENLIGTFLEAGELSLSLRKAGLKKEIKPDNTPVSNGDLEVNKFITKKTYKVSNIKKATASKTIRNQCHRPHRINSSFNFPLSNVPLEKASLAALK